MVAVQHLLGPTTFPPTSIDNGSLSIFSYNVLLPNSVDGWWTYKMYLPPLTEQEKNIASWEYRQSLLKDRIAEVDADIVCLQEVCPLSFDSDFAFMGNELGYDGQEMFKKGRFRPATFWKTDRCELASPPVHKDRTLLTAFRRRKRSDMQADDNDSNQNNDESKTWYVLNCHLQAGKQGSRRVRQIHEGIRAALTFARKLKEKEPESNVPLVVCGDFNGGAECGAIRYLEDGYIDETLREDGEAVSSGRKQLPLIQPLTDVATTVVERQPPPTLVVSELISILIKGGDSDNAYENPELSDNVVERLHRIYKKLATHHQHTAAESGSDDDGTADDLDLVMGINDVERYLIRINKQVGRGSEFREAAEQMGWENDEKNENGDSDKSRPRVTLPTDGILTLGGFVEIYRAELRQGKFWGIAYDLAVLGEPLPSAGVFESRYDRMYFTSTCLQPTAVMDFVASEPCPNDQEPSDHLPVAASFQLL